MAAVKVFAPAKINLCLHITGQRADGYHLLDSLVVFADVGDVLEIALNTQDTGTNFGKDVPVSTLCVTGPMAEGVPTDASNLVMRAADLMAVRASIRLEKHLPAAAGIGGGSADAAATLRAIAETLGQDIPPNALQLGADVPVCLLRAATRMRGIGDILTPVVNFPKLSAVLVNPGVHVSTGAIFNALETKENTPISPLIPRFETARQVAKWLLDLRNDLELPAIREQPIIGDVLAQMRAQKGCDIARMSGSGATCFALYESREHARAAAGAIGGMYPDWWVRDTVLT